MIKLHQLVVAVAFLAVQVPIAVQPATLERNEALNALSHALNVYVYPTRLAEMRAVLARHRATYLKAAGDQEFADAVTADLRLITHDKHLSLDYSPESLPDFKAPSQAERQRRSAQQSYANAFIPVAMRLPGNIGFLRIQGFVPPSEARSVIDSAMSFLSRTDAMIIDLRGNDGGRPESVAYLLGYFFQQPAQLTSIITRAGDARTTQNFFTAKIAGGSYYSKPLVVLIDNETFSAGEEMAYDLGVLHRASLVGLRTAGGANPGHPIKLTDHFSAFIPVGYALNPHTHTSWEGVGVAPTVSCSATATLVTGYRIALRLATPDPKVDSGERLDALRNPQDALKHSLLNEP